MVKIERKVLCVTASPATTEEINVFEGRIEAQLVVPSYDDLVFVRKLKQTN